MIATTEEYIEAGKIWSQLSLISLLKDKIEKASNIYDVMELVAVVLIAKRLFKTLKEVDNNE
jgi:hypothetical protein